MRAIFLREGIILLLFWMSPASFPAKLDAILRTVSLLRPYQEAKPPSLPPMANGSLFGSAGTALRRTSQSERCGAASSPWAETALARGEPSNTTTFLMLGVALFLNPPGAVAIPCADEFTTNVMLKSSGRNANVISLQLRPRENHQARNGWMAKAACP